MTFFNFLPILQATKSQFFENGKLEKKQFENNKGISFFSELIDCSMCSKNIII